MAIAVTAATSAGFGYLENVSTKQGAKQELATNEVAIADLAKRLARIEGERSAEKRLCACVPLDLPMPPIGPLLAEEPDPDALEEPVAFRKPARDDPRVQRKLEEYGW